MLPILKIVVASLAICGTAWAQNTNAVVAEFGSDIVLEPADAWQTVFNDVCLSQDTYTTTVNATATLTFTGTLLTYTQSRSNLLIAHRQANMYKSTACAITPLEGSLSKSMDQTHTCTTYVQITSSASYSWTYRSLKAPTTSPSDSKVKIRIIPSRKEVYLDRNLCYI